MTTFRPPVWGMGLGNKAFHLFKSVSESEATGVTSCGLSVMLPVKVYVVDFDPKRCTLCDAVLEAQRSHGIPSTGDGKCHCFEPPLCAERCYCGLHTGRRDGHSG